MPLGFHSVPWRSRCLLSVQCATLGRSLRWRQCGRPVASHPQPRGQLLEIPHTLVESFSRSQHRSHILFNIYQYPSLHSGADCRTEICFLTRGDSYVSFQLQLSLAEKHSA